ncbi:MAG TPA: citrate/2-methylcitrate synthase [Candidatus Paceibacterota bacterium]|nr:citrate/2-methylcitrate synthase [Candidatus Paceibacterota bacterium]
MAEFMTPIEAARKGKAKILVLGSHPAIVQSILDFDFISGKKSPSVLGLITGNRKAEKYFFGQSEMLIPCYPAIDAVPSEIKKQINWMLNLQSGRRAFESTIGFFEAFPQALGGHIFAENMPEKHATELISRFGSKYLIAGPSGVGLLIPGSLKLGAIGGVDLRQISASKLSTPGSVAVVSTSGGMTNELIRAVADAGKRLSFAAAIGGDRFPITPLTDMLKLAESDTNTKALVYFGELGGVDEYEIVDMLKSKRFTKPVVAYIAGVIDEAFDEHMQFGHAKALVSRKDESARAKRAALRSAGVIASDTFPEFLEEISKLSGTREISRNVKLYDIDKLMKREKSILSTREIINIEKAVSFVKGKKLAVNGEHIFVKATLEALLGRPVKSKITTGFAEAVFTSLIDHGGHVSGAVNTMITARAGKDLVSSLAAGLLTIGPRFGGAVNAAAKVWLAGVSGKTSPSAFVESESRKAAIIPGIGHLKYRVGLPDPRVEALSKFALLLKKHPYYDFARGIEKVTTGKNGKLILNIDGVIAALFLDILSECEGFSAKELLEFTDAELFNAFFVIPRSVGFISHFIEQKKNDEGLFRLPEELLFVRKKES